MERRQVSLIATVAAVASLSLATVTACNIDTPNPGFSPDPDSVAQDEEPLTSVRDDASSSLSELEGIK